MIWGPVGGVAEAGQPHLGVDADAGASQGVVPSATDAMAATMGP